jgi:protein TonB
MYYARKTQSSTRLVGVIVAIVVNVGVAYALASGLGAQIVSKLTETEVVIIEQEIEPEEEPPPPPPVDVELPPPPPQVVLPEFTFDAPPPPNAIQQVQQVAKPAPRPEVRPPPPKPAPTITQKPVPGRRFERPEYPPASQRAKEEGETTVSVCVDEQGRMTDAKLVKSSGFPRLDEAALKGLVRTRLDPAKNSEGKAVAFCNPPYVFTYVWRLEDAR